MAVGLTLTGTSNNADLIGGAKDDTINSQIGVHTIYAGAGNDKITVGNTSGNTIDAGTGDDRITVGNGNSNTIFAGTGNDRIKVGDGNGNVIDAGAGDDSVTIGDGSNVVSGGDGKDTIAAGNGNNAVDAGAGDDKVTVGDGNNDILGGTGNDTITSGAGNDIIHGGAGNDMVDSGGGNDVVDGGAGNDILVGGAGNDSLLGGAGNDLLIGDGSIGSGQGSGGGSGDGSGGGSGSGAGHSVFNDYLDGGMGNDRLYAEQGNDVANYTMSENIGASDIYDGGSGIDTLTLRLTRAEWLDPQVQLDIAAFLQFLNAHINLSSLESDGAVFQFTAFDLKASRFEDLRVFIDGIETDPYDAVVDAVDDMVTINEDDANSSFGSVLGNDAVPDLVRAVRLVTGPTAGVLTFNAGVDGSPDGTYSFDPAGDFDWLAEGESTTVSFTYEVTDADGDTDQATVTLTVTGSNDAPTITSVAGGAGLSEAPDLTGSATPALNAGGSIAFTDVDVSENAHSVDVAVAVSGVIAGLGLDGAELLALFGTTLNQTGAAGVDGSVDWAFSAADNTFDYLAEGEVVTLTYRVTVTDAEGAQATQDVTIAVSGTNDAPLVTSGAAVGSVTEATNNSVDEVNNATHQATGALGFTDVDLSDLHGVSVSGNDTAGYRGTLSASIDNPSTGDGTGSIGWTFAVSDAALDDLSVGQVLTQTYTITVDDGHGGTASQVVTLTITGAADNLPPVVVGDESATGSEDQQIDIASAALLANDSDPDPGTVLWIASVDDAVHGTVILNGATVEFTPDADFSGQASFTYTITDGIANAGPVTVNLDIAPVADAPTLTIGAIPTGDPTPLPLTGDIFVASYSGDPVLLDGLYHEESSITALAGGGFVVVWNASRADGTGFDAKARLYDAAGNPESGIIVVSPPGFGFASSRWPSVAGLDDGGFVIAWPVTSPYDPFFRTAVYDASGNEVSTTDIVGTNIGIGASVAALDGGYLVAWTENQAGPEGLSVFAQRFDNAGVAQTAVFQAPTFNGPSPFAGAPNYANTGYQTGQSIAGLPDGGFVIIWESLLQDSWDGGNSGDQFGIYGQRFDGANAPVGGEFLVNATTFASQIDASVAALSTGGFVVTWTGPDGNGRGVFGQRFGANGAPDGAEFEVDNNTGTHQERSSVTALSDGGFLIVWESDNGNVYGQRFDTSGAPAGTSVRLNSADLGNQDLPGQESGGFTAAVLADGTLAVTWYVRSNDPSAIFTRLFDLPGSPTGTEDQPYTLPPIAASLNDNDGSETLSIVLSGYPAGATFSVGHADGATWVIDNAGDIASLTTTPLTMTPPENFNGTFSLVVDAIATDTATLSGGPASDTTTTTAILEVTFAPVNDAPVITQLAGPSAADPILVAENTAGSFLTITATDVDNQLLTYTIGTNPDVSYDNSFFTIDPSSGALQFAAPPDFEFMDPGNDDLYKVQITVTDTQGGTALRDYFVQVTDVAEGALGNGIFSAAYLTGNDPWGIPPSDPGSPDAAMNTAFGAGQWTKHNNSFSPDVFAENDFVYLDGGDGATGWFESFINTNRAAMEDFVFRGGTLFINAGRWYGQDNFNLGFGADLDDSEFSGTGNALNTGHPIFVGPNGSAGLAWTGGYFSHDTIDGTGGLVALITGNQGTVLAELSHGDGHVLFGGMTTPYFHSPDPQAEILRANILDYTASYSDDFIFI